MPRPVVILSPCVGVSGCWVGMFAQSIYEKRKSLPDIASPACQRIDSVQEEHGAGLFRGMSC